MLLFAFVQFLDASAGRLASFLLLAQAAFRGFHSFDLFSFGFAEGLDFLLQLLLAFRPLLETDLTAVAGFFQSPQTRFGLFDSLQVLLAIPDSFRIFVA